MRPLPQSPWLAQFILLLTFTTLTSAAPTPVKDIGSLFGDVVDDLANLINDTATALQAFAKVIQDIKNGTTENGLVNMLNITLKNGDVDDDDDDNKKPNGTVITAAGNVTCPDMAVLFARGTGEIGNVGLYTGPSLFSALKVYINGTQTLAIQGIPYTATIAGFLAGGDPTGSKIMASLTNATASACPNTKLVLAGYSQGAQVVHNAVPLMSNATTSQISSVVLFGDPRNGTTIAGVDSGRVLSLCHDKDDICAKSGDIVTLDHLTYNRDAPAAAMHVMQKSALGLMSGDAMNQGMGNVPMVAMAKGQDGGQQVTGLGAA